MIQKLRALFPSLLGSILNSYTQIFFSNNKVFAVIILGVTFFDTYAGICGLFTVMVSNLVAYISGFNTQKIKAGHYGFNSLLVGLGLGIFYQPSLQLFVLLIFVAFLTLFITISLEGVLGKYGLPYLSLPFLFGIWLVTLASRQFHTLEISERGIYSLNEMYVMGGLPMVRIYDWINTLPWYEPVKLYFRSLGAILFQNHLIPGILVSIGLLLYSRIAFTLSWIGFLSAYTYYSFIGANFSELSYSYIGFNFILSAIAVGGFFVVPSFYSYVWVLLLTPLISIILTSTTTLFNLFQLSIFSLPFNIIVLLFLYVLKFRERYFTKPQIVTYQNFSPEMNRYGTANYAERFEKSHLFNIALPFIGSWKVTQGHDGDVTHQDEWRHAWDFEIADDNGKTYSRTGTVKEEYYCYGKPVIAPAYGWIEEVEDGIDENQIGEINIHKNWGNSVVIKHTDFLYTKYSHLKKGSIKVKIGDYVKKGDVIAACGNSGRSPFPHLHFQIQATPYIGSTTIEYPLGRFIEKVHEGYSLRTYDFPQKDTTVSNIESNSALERAFHFIPGQNLRFEEKRSDGTILQHFWEVKSDIYNKTYIWCRKTNSKAWYYFDNDLLLFTYFEGDRNTLLYYFYLGAYKVSTGFYTNLTLPDTYPLTVMSHRFLRFLQDFVAPFYLFLKPQFTMRYLQMEDYLTHSKVRLSSETTMKLGHVTLRKLEFDFDVSSNGLEQFIVRTGNQVITATRLEEA